MQLFYQKNPDKEIILNSEESKHLIKVLRKKEGDIVKFTDGKGGFYKAKITIASIKECKLQIINSENKPRIILLTGPAKAIFPSVELEGEPDIITAPGAIIFNGRNILKNVRSTPIEFTRNSAL